MKRLSALLLLSFVSAIRFASAQDARRPWAEVAPPRFVSVKEDPENPAKVVVAFELEMGAQGADRASVTMMDASGKILQTRTLGRTSRPIKTAEFLPTSSGTYRFVIVASRSNEADEKRSETLSYEFRLPLVAPQLTVLNQGKGAVLLRWDGVAEAEAYEIHCTPAAAAGSAVAARIPAGRARFEHVLSGLTPGERYAFALAVLRGNEKVVTEPLYKTVKDEREKEWFFTWFGQSTRAELNTFKMLDPDRFVFQLRSCTFNPADGQTSEKGGKFTAFHDGISFYYTILDPRTENFELTATFQIDYINPTADGQEGFGLLVLDSLGQHGVSSVNHYTNSAGVIATKFEETIGGVKRTSKDTLGARFVTGLTKEIIASGDSGIARYGSSVSHAFSYDTPLVKTGDVYRITLKKTNTGYHAIYRNPHAAEGDRSEFILYGPEKLQVLDPEHIYVGFAVARGCNATVRDVVFRVTDARADPPGQKEPPQVVPLIAKVDSPMTYTSDSYPFVFYANADGTLTIRDASGKELVREARITNQKDFTVTLRLKRGVNHFRIQFTPDASFKPGDRKVIGRYDDEARDYVEDYSPYHIEHSVVYHVYPGEELYVSPTGTALGKGTRDDPLDLSTALRFVRAGQTVVLEGGVYYPGGTIQVERGNDGTRDMRKGLKSAPGQRAILDFRASQARTAGLVLWGDYWTIEGIDIRNTPGDVKGFQIGGDYNVVRDVRTYRCGDTGLQISGSGSEPPEKWPKHNLVLNCLSYDNKDPASNNADGFAAKLTVGEGNAFRGCIAHHNIDDGWDLYSKIDTGPIGAVLVDSCVAYMNGFLSDGSGNGDGNGFKMGGDGIAVRHILRNSIAYGNGSSGITSNSNPALVVDSCTSYGNKGANINLYGKGDGRRQFVVRNVLSYGGGAGDVYREMPELASPDNFFWNGAVCANSDGRALTVTAFVSTEMRIVPGWKEDGSIDMKGLLVPTPLVPPGVGARLGN